MNLAEALRFVVHDFRFRWQDKLFSIGASIGLVNFNSGAVTLQDILRMADAACYTAKDKGRNRVHVYNADDSDLTRRRQEMGWIGQINKALDEDRFALYTQSIVSISGKEEKMKRQEFLLRMIDEQGNIITPSAFIPAAERYDLMPLLDRWVIKNAFAYCQYVYVRKDPQICGINLSGASIGDENLLVFIKKQLEIFGFPPNLICFEITETSAISNLPQARKLISALRAIGCCFALDDFGSGISSYGYLKQLPVDFLKIDGNFVKNIVNDPVDMAMVESINQIGHIMGIKTIAEFAEDDRVLEQLKKIGVDYAQGYGIDKPHPLFQKDAKFFSNRKLKTVVG
jgi:EAL domain-containing protein (putative c-di-GMP-specific phosphodiesterase class I)